MPFEKHWCTVLIQHGRLPPQYNARKVLCYAAELQCECRRFLLRLLFVFSVFRRSVESPLMWQMRLRARLLDLHSDRGGRRNSQIGASISRFYGFETEIVEMDILLVRIIFPGDMCFQLKFVYRFLQTACVVQIKIY